MNPETVIGETSIALPPDTAYQKVFYKTIEPPPLNVRVDPDGNWLAFYRLAGKEKLTVMAKGQVKIFAHPQEHFLLPNDSVLSSNLKPDNFWEVDNEEIQSQAKNFTTPQEIYNFVVKTLNYDYSRVGQGAERLGALDSLKRPNEAICTEFTDLFIALSRANGIPAREINGFAYTTNEKLRPLSLIADILHSWPEYWDKENQIWVPIDPTWGDTTGGIDYFSKLDLNHFAFVIHGQSSETPYPAGAYKLENLIQKDIQVTFGEYKAESSPQVVINSHLPQRIFAGLETPGQLTIKNFGSSALYQLPIKISSNFVRADYSPNELAVLPPFASQKIEVKLINQSWLMSGNATLTVLAGKEKLDYNIKVDSIIWHQVLPIVGGCFVGIIFFFVTYKAGRLLIQKLRR